MIPRIPAKVPDAAVEGVNLRPGTLRRPIWGRRTLLVLLR
jgi:hypothetical protein